MRRMIYKLWEKKVSRKRRIPGPRKILSSLAGVNPKLKQKAYDHAMVVRKFQSLLLSKGFKKKTELRKEFLADFNSGAAWSDGSKGSISKICNSTLYNWENLYRNKGLAGLVPRYKTKSSTQRTVFRHPCTYPEMKFPGQPRQNGRAKFLERIKRRWKGPPLEGPVDLKIFYSMAIPRKEISRMKRRMRFIRHQIPHMGRPNLDTLNTFIIDSLSGIVFKNHCQIIRFHCEKEYAWWPQTRIRVRALKG